MSPSPPVPETPLPGIGRLLWSRFTWRHWRRSLRSSLLLVIILALGVAAFFSIRLANRAAVSGFQQFSENLTGGSDLVIRSPDGRLPESDLRLLRDASGDLPLGIFPVLEASAALISNTEELTEPLDGKIDTSDARSAKNASAPLLRLSGVDLVALPNAYYLRAESENSQPPLLPANEGNSGGDTGSSLLGEPTRAFIAPTLAAALDLRSGDSFNIAVDGRIVAMTVAGILLDDPARAQVPQNLLLLDLPGLQHLLQRPGSLSRIELRVPTGVDRSEILSQLRQRVGALAEIHRWLVETPDDRAASSQAMTAAFRLNLTVLSTLALLVGVYLILQALEAAVVRRRREIAVLRSLGVTAGQIRRAWLCEALALGVIGTFLGLLLGWGAAQFAVGNIAKTVSALYYETTTTAAGLHAGEIAFAALFGIGASLLAGWLPARDAAATPPVQSLRGGQRSEGPVVLRRPMLGLALLLAGWLLTHLPPIVSASGAKIPLGGYLAALACLAGLSILVGALFRPLSKLLGSKRRHPALVYAASQLRRPTGRHRLTAAGLVVAVGMAAGMGILVHSFEGTLTNWISTLLKADLYVAPAGVGSASSDATLREVDWRSLAEDDAVAGVDVIRRYPITFEGRTTVLAGSEYALLERSLRLTWREPPTDRDPQSLSRLRDDGLCPAWISESFSQRFDRHRGDRLAVPTPSGPQTVIVEGVYSDYHNESGTVLVNRKFTEKWFGGDRAISNLAIFLHPKSDIEALRARWSEAYPALVIRTNRRLREEALRVFHQTFAVTHALEAIGIAVAVAGLGLTLASLMIERRDEITTLKQLGMERLRIGVAAAIESLGLALVGTLGGLLLSLALGYVLIYVVNRQSFGWTLQFQVPFASMAGLAALTLTTSAVVGFLIGRSGAHLKAEQEE